MRHAPGLHKTDALREKRLPRAWSMPVVVTWAVITAALTVAGAIMSSVAASDHKIAVFDWSDAINHAVVLLVVAAVVGVCWVNQSLDRRNRSLMRAIKAANQAAGLPDPGEPAQQHRDAA